MTLLDLLKAKWTVAGLDAPIFAWFAAAGLLVYSFYQLAKLAWLVARECRIHQHFSVALAAKLRQVIGGSIGSTLRRMVATVEELSQVLRTAEARQQDSIADSLGELLGRLEHSIATALGDISARFTESLAGSAQQEFERVISALGGSAGLLDAMSAQFQTTQSALSELVTFAKNSTEEQTVLGKSQVEELSTLVRVA